MIEFIPALGPVKIILFTSLRVARHKRRAVKLPYLYGHRGHLGLLPLQISLVLVR